MANEVNGLMGASDEEDWERECLFNTVDELCNLKKGGYHLSEPLIPSLNTLPDLTSQLLPKFQSPSAGNSRVPVLNTIVDEWSLDQSQRLGGGEFDNSYTKPVSSYKRVNTQLLIDGFVTNA